MRHGYTFTFFKWRAGKGTKLGKIAMLNLIYNSLIFKDGKWCWQHLGYPLGGDR